MAHDLTPEELAFVQSAFDHARNGDLPVRFAGVNFRQGDWLYADEDGVVVAQRALL